MKIMIVWWCFRVDVYVFVLKVRRWTVIRRIRRQFELLYSVIPKVDTIRKTSLICIADKMIKKLVIDEFHWKLWFWVKSKVALFWKISKKVIWKSYMYIWNDDHKNEVLFFSLILHPNGADKNLHVAINKWNINFIANALYITKSQTILLAIANFNLSDK